MNLCGWVVPAMVLLSALDARQVPDRPSRDEAAAQELQQLQGTWQCAALQEDGKKAAAELQNRTIFFGAETFLIQQDGKIVSIAAHKVDPSRTPKTINALVTGGPHKGEIMQGIYELRGDTLTICFDVKGQKRPSEFQAAPGSGFSLAVYKRRQALTQDFFEIRGKYQSESLQADGSTYTARAVIERRGDAYLVTYSQNKTVTYTGIGIRTGNTLAVCWTHQGQVGITVYQIEKGPRLVGQYTDLGGIGFLFQETLTPEEKGNH